MLKNEIKKNQLEKAIKKWLESTKLIYYSITWESWYWYWIEFIKSK
jgi:cytoskeletal protein RodZ